MFRAPPLSAPPEERPPPIVPPRRRRRWRWVLFKYLFILAVWGGLAGGAALLWFAWDLPRPEAALDATRRPSLTLLDTSGRLYASYGDVVGDPLRLSDMPPWLPAAAVAVEDRRFWQHGAFDFIGIARAAFVDLTTGRIAQGGSTIAQQVAKNLFLTNARTIRRKVQEVLLTLWLERSFTKREILEIWLNRVYLGSGAFGVDAAARMYFGISARRVNLWQAAVLAGIPRAPSRFNPRVDPAAATARAKDVLQAMVEAGALTPEAAREAAAQIRFPPRPSVAGYFADWISDQVEPLLPPGADAQVHTTLDSRLQAIAESRLEAILAGPGAAAGATQGAVVALDAATGAVRAMVGGRDYRTGPYNRAVLARRQPGSSFKPFVWTTALEAGMTPDDTVIDGPIRLGTWSPGDFERRFLGEVTLETALAESLNTVSVRLLLKAGGPDAVIATARRLGIASRLPRNATLALGTGEVSLLEITSAYAAFFNGGRRVSPTGIEQITTDGRATTPALPDPPRVLAPDIAAAMRRMLAAVVARGTGRAAALPGRFVAGKTGTTQDYHDAWFIGSTGGLMIGVWIGNDDNAPMKNITGGTLPARLFHDIAAADAS